MIPIKNKKFLIVGAGKSGVASAFFLTERGARVTVTDSRPISNLDGNVEKLKNGGVQIEAGRHRIETFLEPDYIILSPGVSMSIEPVLEAKKLGIAVISEIELAYHFINAPIIAITGTNGKTTTTSLVGEIFKKSQKDVFVGGNIGNPLIEGAGLERCYEYVVAEVSSFQLESIKDFRPKISVLLNISPDHLDRYSTYRDYAEAKRMIFLNQEEGDFAVLNADDPLILNMADSLKGMRKVFFSKKGRIQEGIYLKENFIVSEIQKKENRYNIKSFKLRGGHNIDNIMAAIAATEICHCSSQDIASAVNSFHGLEHRVEFVEEISGVSYFNDSKATNIGAVEKSLESFDEPIILIAGGKDKGAGYDSLKEIVQKKVKCLILFGQAQEAIFKSMGTVTKSIKVGTLPDAVALARAESSPGDVVLLSPACSSYDMFRDYEERGEAFKTIVRTFKSKPVQLREEAGEAKSQI